jgi:hypothetical protein
MTSMRAKLIQQAGWISFFFIAMIAGARAASAADTTFDNIDVIDPSLDGKMAVLRVGSDIGANKLLSVFAGLRNKTGHSLNLEIETIYKDTFGNPLNTGSWIPFTLEAHEEKEYHSASISEQATDFLVRVRRAAVTSHHD